MPRSLVSFDIDDKKWLEKKSAEIGKPMSYLIRTAVKKLRESEEKSFDSLLAQTSGIWNKGDGLEYQQRVREEWD